MLGAKVSDLYGSLAGNFFRVTFAGREKSAVRAKGPWNEPKGEARYFQQEEPRLERLRAAACVWNGSIDLAKLCATCARSRSQLTQLLAPSSNYLSNGIITACAVVSNERY